MNSPGPFPRLSGSADATVRPARPGDAEAVARVQAVTWRTAYRGVLPREVLDDWDDAAVTASWSAAISAPPTPGHGIVVALERETVVGFAAYGPAEVAADSAPDPAGPSSEIAVLLVEPRYGRRGHGSRLLAAVTDLSRANGTARLQTWIPEPDEVSARFFESAGWAPDGWAQTLQTASEPVRQLRWHTLLDDGGPGNPEEHAP